MSRPFGPYSGLSIFGHSLVGARQQKQIIGSSLRWTFSLLLALLLGLSLAFPLVARADDLPAAEAPASGIPAGDSAADDLGAAPANPTTQPSNPAPGDGGTAAIDNGYQAAGPSTAVLPDAESTPGAQPAGPASGASPTGSQAGGAQLGDVSPTDGSISDALGALAAGLTPDSPVALAGITPALGSPFDATYYVSALGSDLTGDGSQANPWATLGKSAAVINSLSPSNGDYLVYVMSDLTMTDCARYYNVSVTITSLSAAPATVTRGTTFNAITDLARGTYNPSMLEIQSTDLSASAPAISLTLENITFDDAYRYAGSSFGYAPTNGSGTGTNYVQNAIVSSDASDATIILNAGATLQNFGGMTAVHVQYGADLIMNSGSLIQDVGSTATTRQNTSVTNWGANGEGAVVIVNGGFWMYAGARITQIANAHGVKFSGTVSCFIDGEIDHLKGNNGSETASDGRGFKSAVLFNGSPTLDPNTGLPGSAIIGPNAYIHDNLTKSGTVSLSRNTQISVRIYGRINNNTGGTGSTANLAGTNGGGIYIVAGGTVYLEAGSEIIGNKLSGISGYGGAASVQQTGSRLIMNGGTVSGNTAPNANTGGLVISKGDASFVMNGGTVDNGAFGVRLYESGSDGTVGKLTLNAGTVSGVTVDAAVPFGYPIQRYLYLDDAVTIGTGYALVAGRQVYPLSPDYYIGNPNQTNAYPIIRTALPKGWTLPSTDANVIAFWLQKSGIAEFAVPAPAGSGGANYDSSRPYFAAVLAMNSSGVAAASTVKLYATTLVNGRIQVSVPLADYPNGATVALAQPGPYDEIAFSAPATLAYQPAATAYNIPYTASYDLPESLQAEMLTDGFTTGNTTAQFVIHPDPSTVPVDLASIVINSAIMELAGSPTIDAVTGDLLIPVRLKAGWDTATDRAINFAFNCSLAAADFQAGQVLSLTGELALTGGVPSESFLIPGNFAQTELFIPDPIILFDGNGGTIAVGDENRSVLFGETLGSNMPPDPVRDDYVFLGWNTEQDGNGTSFTASTVVTADITVYAQWRSVTPATTNFTVRYLPGTQGTFAAVTHADLADGSTTPAPPATPGAVGWTFVGWSPTWQPTVNANVDYVAQWRINTYTVTFTDGLGYILKTQQVDYGQAATAPTLLSRSGYGFTGWDQDFSRITGDLTVNALWSPNSLPVTGDTIGYCLLGLALLVALVGGVLMIRSSRRPGYQNH